MGRLFLIHLEGRIYSCRNCNTHLAKVDELGSKNFHGDHTNAYLFHDVVNVFSGAHQDRQMTTGLYTITNSFCNSCQLVIGWKYEVAHDQSQEYKEGKFVLERVKIDFGDWTGIQNYTDVPLLVDHSDDEDR